jgi:hypothetical protein
MFSPPRKYSTSGTATIPGAFPADDTGNIAVLDAVDPCILERLLLQFLLLKTTFACLLADGFLSCLSVVVWVTEQPALFFSRAELCLPSIRQKVELAFVAVRKDLEENGKSYAEKGLFGVAILVAILSMVMPCLVVYTLIWATRVGKYCWGLGERCEWVRQLFHFFVSWGLVDWKKKGGT